MYNQIKFKIISLVLFFFLLVTPTFAMLSYYVQPAYAGINSFVSAGLNGANSVSTSGGAGVFHTQGENIYSLGYSNVRFNTAGQSLQLFTITPPNFSIGCSGISAEWGAFAMLGSHLMQVLQSIIQSGAVLIFAFNMVLGVLCKQCQTIMNQIEAIANKLNGLNFNSCQTAEAMGNLAGAELGNMINKTSVAGATNAFADQVSKTLGNVSNAVGNFENTVNGDMNCASTEAGAQALVNSGFTNCGQQAAAHQFQLGSMLRYALSQAHIGLIAGSKPGSGGADDLIGILRGEFIGDIVGYPSQSNSGNNVLRFISPSAPVSQNTEGSYTTDLVHALLYGSQGMSVIKIAPINPTTPTTLSQVEEGPTSDCFPGFYFYYKFYLDELESSYFQMAVPSSASVSSICPNVTLSDLNQQQLNNFITNSTLPVILISKLAYVNQDPGLMNEAAKAMALGYLHNIFTDMLKAVENNVVAGKNADKKPQLKMAEKYASQINVIARYISTEYQQQLSTLNIQQANVTYYANLNKEWVSSLSQYGLAGNYNYNP